MDFPYEKKGFVFTSILILIAIFLVALIYIQMNGDIAMFAILLFILLTVFFAYGISPMLTAHSIENDVLVLRQGIFFKGMVELDNIISYERMERTRRRSGVFFSIKEPTLFVTTRSIDLIEIRLREPQRFKSVFGRKVDRIIFDSTENYALIREMEKLIPANQGRRS